MRVLGVCAPGLKDQPETGVPMTPPSVDYRIIPLTQNQIAYVSPRVYDSISAYKWYAFWSKRGHCFYAVRATRVNGQARTMFMHRQIMGLELDDPRTVDHKDRKRTLDNTDNNLRFASRSQQRLNQGMRTDNTSGFKGVFPLRGKWASEITVNHRRIPLGRFDSKEEAAEAYRRAAMELHGEFACFD